MKRTKFGSCLLATLLTVVLALSSVVPTRAANCEEWYAKRGMFDKEGDNENGYTIGSRGDTGYSMIRYGEKFDLLSTEIEFSFKTYPTDGKSQEVWAYMQFGLDLKEKSFLNSLEKNEETGTIEFILWQRADGKFQMSLFNGYERVYIVIQQDFDYDAVHTLSFADKAVGIFLVFDGIPYSQVDFTSAFEQHTGENAGNTYFAVGGQQGYEFTNLKIKPLEKVDTPQAAPNNGSNKKPSKLGDLLEEEEPVNEGMSPLLYIPIGITGILVIVLICLILKHKQKKKTTE